MGESEPVSVILGGGKVPPANLVGLATMGVPAAVRLSIARSEAGAVLSWAKEFAEMNLQSSGDLNGGWQAVSGMKTTNETSVLMPVSIDTERSYFRLRN